MFYQFDDDRTTVEVQDINENLITAGYITQSELNDLYEHFSFAHSTVKQCKEEKKYFRSNIEVYDDYTFGTLKITDVGKMSENEDCIAFYIKKHLFLVVDVIDTDCTTRDRFFKSLDRFSPATITLEKLIYAFLESLIDGDNRALEDNELEINKLEELVLRDKAGKDFNIELLYKKKDLLVLRNYYEQLIDIGHDLEENENEIFESEDLRYFRIFNDKVVRLRENVDILRNSVVHLRDAYQAYLDLKLNQTMKIFTVVSTIFFPLTVIVGWYGMNFQSMPEFAWKYGYLFVITLSIIVVAVLTFIFRKKKWL